ncbi:MAG: hypothetical protein P1U36_10760 [Legionellaceae bacterium]|nr:hypothetical protein [Legionellaceae bacterium]
MTLLKAIEAADLNQIDHLLEHPSESESSPEPVTETHLLAAITNHAVDKAHCKHLFDAFTILENIIPASCIIAALEQTRIDIFLSMIRTNHLDAPTEGTTAKLQRVVSFKGLKQNDEAKYEQHKASFLDIIQDKFSPEEKQQLHAILNTENHPIQAVISSENLGDLLAITMPDSKDDNQKESTQIEHSDAMSTGTPPPSPQEIPILRQESALSRQESGDTLNSDDVKLETTGPDAFNDLSTTSTILRNDLELDAKLQQISDESTSAREQEEKAAFEETARLQALEHAKAARLQAIEDAKQRVMPHLDRLREELSVGLGEQAYQKVQPHLNNFMDMAQNLALNAQRTQEEMTAFREQVKTKIIPEGRAALLENESYASFFCRKIMDALHVIFNMLAPIFPSTKNSFFQTAPSILTEQLETSAHIERAMTAACGA